MREKIFVERICRELQSVEVGELGAESQRVDDARRVEQIDCTAREVLGGTDGVNKRQLQNQIDAAQDGQPCPRPFVEYGRLCALSETAAHDRDDFRAAKFFYFGDLICVPRMKRIVLCDYPDSHDS